MATAMDTSSYALLGAEAIECWDNDPDFAEIDNFHRQLPPVSPQYSRAGTDYHRRESVSSSRMSVASTYDLDFESGDLDHHVPLDDSPTKAIASAIHAGIPIPKNVPSSALVGGTIKRLGTNKRGRKVSTHDDWGDDLELPTRGNAFTIKQKEFPDSLAHILEGKPSLSPTRPEILPATTISSKLCKYRDIPDDDGDLDFLGDGDDVPTLRVSSIRNIRPTASLLLTPPMSESATKEIPSVDDDFEHDFEFPADAPLQLNLNKGGDNTRPPATQSMETGFEDWGDSDSALGSSYYGSGPRRERGDDRLSSAVSVRSPSISGMTVESEDDVPLEGLVLPDGVLSDLQQRLKNRKQAAAAAAAAEPAYNAQLHIQKDLDNTANEDFLDGLEIGDGDILDKNKLNLNRNVKHKKQPRNPSPVRRTALSLTFTTNKQTLSSSLRNNRLSQGHPLLLPPVQMLEPVVERENQQAIKRNPRSRWSGGPGITTDHRWQTADHGMPIPPPPPIPQSRTERQQRNMSNTGKKISTRNLKTENVPPKTTTSAQLLRAKRSMPNIAKTANSPSKATRPPSRASNGRPSSRNSAGRPPSSSNSTGRPTSSGNRPTSSGSRPTSSGGRPQSRTSVGRPPSRNEPQTTRPHGNMTTFRHPAPFVPGGASVHNSHHISAKVSRHNIKRDERPERPELDRRPVSRVQQRTTPRHSPSSSGGSNITAKRANVTPKVAPEHLRKEAAAFGTMTQPTRKRNFGDGTELEAFDDLPTSARIENRYIVTPVAKGAPKIAIRANTKSTLKRDCDAESPKKKLDRTNRSPNDSTVPRFARDTAASRNAREITQQRLGMSTPVQTSPNAERWRAQIAARSSVTPRNNRRKTSLSKPHLIKPMGNINTLPKETAANGMSYNPRTMRWDGNERDLQAFEPVEARTPLRQPALIAKVGQSGGKAGIQVVGGMVFDPSRMCWLKVDEDPDDDLDPFEGVDDIPDDLMSIDDQSISGRPGTNNSIVMGDVSTFGGASRMSGGGGEFVVGEEFDVGPLFVGKQRDEEEKWRSKVDGWISIDVAAKWENRYAIKEILAGYNRR